MNFDNRSVTQDVFHARLTREHVKNTFKNIGFDPIPKPFEGRVPFAEMGRKIAPRAVSTRNPKHGFKKQGRIPPVRPGSDFLPKQCGSISDHI